MHLPILLKNKSKRKTKNLFLVYQIISITNEHWNYKVSVKQL